MSVHNEKDLTLRFVIKYHNLLSSLDIKSSTSSSGNGITDKINEQNILGRPGYNDDDGEGDILV